VGCVVSDRNFSFGALKAHIERFQVVLGEGVHSVRGGLTLLAFARPRGTSPRRAENGRRRLPSRI